MIDKQIIKEFVEEANKQIELLEEIGETIKNVERMLLEKGAPEFKGEPFKASDGFTYSISYESFNKNNKFLFMHNIEGKKQLGECNRKIRLVLAPHINSFIKELTDHLKETRHLSDLGD